MSYNKIILIGRLGGDPETNKTESGKTYSKFNLATTDSYRGKDGEWVNEVTWHKLVLWNKLAEYAQKSLKKGDQISIEGKQVNEIYEDKEGAKKSSSHVNVSFIKPLQKSATGEIKGENEEESGVHGEPSPAAAKDGESSIW